MAFRFLIAAVALAAGVLAGCSASNPTLATIGDEQFTLQDFENHYAKNNGGWEAGVKATLPERQTFLDLILKFRLKVGEARRLGLDRDSAIQSELETYRNTVAQTVMLEREIFEPAVKRAYDRKAEQVRASHILLRIPPNPSPEDTLAAHTKAMSIIAQLPTAPFDSLARAHSEDPSAAVNGGDLGFFGGGRMVPEFEDACFSLKPGEYTKVPVRTQFGYHIIKVVDRQKNPGAVQISHILLRFAPDRSDSTAIEDTAKVIMSEIRNGLSFTDAVTRYSKDPGSIPRGGDIGFYDRDRLPPEMGKALFGAAIDSVLQPFRMDYGYHIIKVNGFRPVPSYEESEKELRTQYQQQRYPAELKRFTERQRAAYRPVIDSAVIEGLIARIDTTKAAASPGWSDSIDAEFLNRTIITVGTRRVNVHSFVERLSTDSESRTKMLTPANVRGLADKVSDAVVLEVYGRAYAEGKPFFQSLMRDYEDGILLYRIEQDEVWKKVVINDSLLREYHAKTPESYRWPDRVSFAEIFVPTDSIAQAIAKRITKATDFLALAETTTTRPGYKDKKGVWALQNVSTNELSQRAWLMAVDSVSAPMKFQYGWSIIETLQKDPARSKTFEEASAEVATAYQEVASKQREKEWIEQLKAKNPIRINEDVLPKAFAGPARDAK